MDFRVTLWVCMNTYFLYQPNATKMWSSQTHNQWGLYKSKCGSTVTSVSATAQPVLNVQGC